MRDSYGVLHVAIRGLKLRQGVVSSQFGHIINFRIGERIYTVEKKNDCRKHWNEAFSLDLTIHQHLFNTLQVDVYEIKRLMGRQHCGRFELRIQNLIAGVTSQWYNLRKRSQLCYANLADLHLSHLDSNEDSNYTGKVLLEIFYQSGEISKNSPELPLPSIPMVPFSQISADLSTQSFDDEENALNFDLIEITLAQNNNSNEESDSEIRVRNLDPVTGVESIDMESLRNALPRVEVLKDSPASKNSRSVLFKETKNELLDFPSLNLDGSKVGGFEEGDSSTDLTGKEIIDKEGEEEEDESKNKIESYLDPKSECKTLQSKTRQELLFDWQKIDRPNFSNISGMNSFITEVSNSMDRPKLIVNSLKTNEEDMEMKKKNTSLNLNCEIESDPVSKGGRPSKTLVNNNSEQIFSLETTVMDEKTSILSHSDRGMRIKSIIKSLFSWMMDKKDREIVDDVIDLYGAFVQGVDCGRLSLAASFFLHQRFYSDIPLPFTCSLILKKNELLMSRFMFRYALSACGWPALNFFGKRSEMISDALSSRANIKAIIQYLQLPAEDLLICDLDQHLHFRPNFFVALDRRLSAVICGIRGTMSFRDVLTDLSCEYVPWLKPGGMVHSGVLRSARWFRVNVCKQLIFFAQKYGMRNIYMTGHSLGGATAAMVTIMLKDMIDDNQIEESNLDVSEKIDLKRKPPSGSAVSYTNSDSSNSIAWSSNSINIIDRDSVGLDCHNNHYDGNKDTKNLDIPFSQGDQFCKTDAKEGGDYESEKISWGKEKKTFDYKSKINVHCYSYGTAPFLSESLASNYDDLIDSFVLGEDIVPRLSYGSMTDLQTLLVHGTTIAKSSHLLVRPPYNLEVSDKLKACRDAVLASSSRNPRLYPPGRMHHIIELQATNGKRYTVVDTCHRKRFSEVLIRKTMFTSHMPNRYDQAFEDSYMLLLMHELDERRVEGEKLSFASKIQKIVDEINEAAISSKKTDKTCVRYAPDQ